MKIIALLFLALQSAWTPRDVVQEYIASFNAGEARMKSYFEKYGGPNVPVETRLERYREMKARMQRLEPKSVTTHDGQTVNGRMGTADGDVNMTFRLSADQPPKLLGILVEDAGDDPAAGPETSQGPKLKEDEAVREIGALLDQRVKADEFSGVVLVARGDRIVFEKAAGLANANTRTANTVDTIFNLGSINKIFTKVAIGRLIADGKLSLDDTIGKHLPDYPNKDAAAAVTVRHLLAMRSGIGDFFGPRFIATPKDRIRKLADYLPLFGDMPLEFKPGERERYSNGGYIVLGLIIEKLAGDYYEFVRKTIFDAAGMPDTRWFESDQAHPRVATGYTKHLGLPRRSNVHSLPARGSSAGGGYSTAHDMLRFALAVEKGRFNAVGAPREVRVGGLGIAGGAPGMNAILDSGLAGGYTLVVLANYDPPAAEAMARQVRGVLGRVLQ